MLLLHLCYLADSLSTVPVGIGKHKSSKMAHFVFKCNKEDYFSVYDLTLNIVTAAAAVTIHVIVCYALDTNVQYIVHDHT